MADYLTRRATVDDVPALCRLWAAAHFPAAELEKDFTDFQLAENPDHSLAGAIAMQITGVSGRVHSEACFDSALTDTLRPLLWARLQSVAQNHGLCRLWTQEAAPWWRKDAGFAPPDAVALEKFPAAFGASGNDWLTLRLRDEAATPEELEKEIARFKALERERTEKLLQRARALKAIGMIITAGLFIFAMGVLFWFLTHHRQG